MSLRREVTLVIVILALILIVQYLTHSYVTHFEFLPMVQGDMGGRTYIWYEKFISRDIISLYSPSKSSSYPSDLNNPFLTIIPSIIMIISRISNMYEVIYIFYLEVIVIAFISMYILVRSYLNKIYIALLTATLYAFSPLLLGIYFTSELEVAYALLPLGLLPIIMSIKEHYLNYDKIILYTLLQAFVSLNIAWLHIEIFILFIFTYLLISLLLIVLERNRRKILQAVWFLTVSAITGLFPVYFSHYIASPMWRYNFIAYRTAVSRLPPTALAMNFIEFIGLCDYESFDSLLWITRSERVLGYQYLYTGYIVYVSIFSIILWIPIIVYLFNNFDNQKLSHKDNIVIITIILTLTLYIIYKKWNFIRLAIIENVPTVPPFSLLRSFAIVFRTPARLNSLIAPLALLSFARAIDSLSKSIKLSIIEQKLKIELICFSRKAAVVLLIIVIMMANLLSLVIPGTFTYLHHVTRSSPYAFEWPWSTISYIRKAMFNQDRPFQYYVLDYTAFNPHYIYLGGKFLTIAFRSDLDLIQLYKNTNYSELLRALGVKYVIISNWTSYWYFLSGDIAKILDKELATTIKYDNITAYCTSCGRIVLWIKIPKIGPRTNMNITITYCNSNTHVHKYEPIYTPLSKPIKISLSDIGSKIIKNDELTIDAIVKVNSLGVNHDQWIIAAKEKSWDNYGFALSYGWGNDLFFNIGNMSYFVGTIIKDWSSFHRITAVYDHGMLKLYVDGALVSKRYVEKRLVFKELVAYIGGRDDGAYKLNGTILDLSILPYALDPSRTRITKIVYTNNKHVYVTVTNLGNETLYNQWVKVVIPIRNNETVCNVVAKMNNIDMILRFYIEDYEVSTNISWVEVKHPMLLLGGATALSAFTTINTGNFVPVFMRQISMAQALDMICKNSIPILMANIDPIDFYLTVTKIVIDENISHLVFLYKYYTPTKLAELRGFGRYYGSKPLFGVIPSDPYGTLSISPYLIYIPRGTSFYSIKISNINLTSSAKKYYVLLRLTAEGENPRIDITLNIANHVLSRSLRGKGYQFFTGWIYLGSFTSRHKHNVLRNIILSLSKNDIDVYLDSIAMIPQDVLDDITKLNEQVIRKLCSNIYYLSVSTALPKRVPYIRLDEKIETTIYSGYGILGSDVAKAYGFDVKHNTARVSIYKPLSGRANILLYVIESSDAILDIRLYSSKSNSSMTYISNKTMQLGTITKPTWMIIDDVVVSSGVYKVAITLKKGYAVIGAIAFSNIMFTKSKNVNTHEYQGKNLVLSVKREPLKGVIDVRVHLLKGIIKSLPCIYIYVKEPYYAYKVKVKVASKYDVLPAYGIFMLIKIPIASLSVNTTEIAISIEPNINPQIPYIVFSIISLVCMALILVLNIKHRLQSRGRQK